MAVPPRIERRRRSRRIERWHPPLGPSDGDAPPGSSDDDAPQDRGSKRRARGDRSRRRARDVDSSEARAPEWRRWRPTAGDDTRPSLSASSGGPMTLFLCDLV
jgi:hypothetical protein